ncbi:MAG: LicD family protein [Clostridia bacterium]|nr:LicD family protein [Clostridia bacterium]
MELSRLQDLVYNIFVEFDRICRKYDLAYSMEGGTLLGAVKYQNFVPWDDDIDVIMRRDDYEKFLKVAPKELGEDFFLQSYNNVSQFPLNYAKICYNKVVIYDYDYSHLKKMHHGIFMDIFPIDNVKVDKLKKHCSMVGVLTGARKTKLKVNLGKLPKLKRIVYKLVSKLPMSTLVSLQNKVCGKYNKKDTGYRYEVCNSNKKFPPMPSKMYDEYIELQFRDKKFKAIKDYDKLLKSRFSEDYMETLPPVENRKPSHNQNIIEVEN